MLTSFKGYNESSEISLRTSKWFANFANNTDQKKISGRFIKLLMNELALHDIQINPSLIDIGCGDGYLSRKVGKWLKKKQPNFIYHGIDRESKFVMKTARLLAEVGLPNTNIIEGDCFSDGFDKIKADQGLILASHIAYYAENIAEFTKNCINKLGMNGLGIFIHQSADSNVETLRKKYKAATRMGTATQIEEALSNSEVLFFKITCHSSLNFPDNIHTYIDDLLINSEALLKEDSIEEAGYDLAKSLLEFIIQRPLEALYGTELIAYLKDMKQLLNTHTQFPIELTMHIGLSKRYTNEFKKTILETVQNSMIEKITAVANYQRYKLFFVANNQNHAYQATNGAVIKQQSFNNLSW